MIVDSSALVAVVRGEPDASRYLNELSHAAELHMSAGSYLETCIVVDSIHDPVLSRRFDDLLESLGVVIQPFTWRQTEIARQAYKDYGKYSGHPAKLNMGDCFAYALAREMSQPLLYKGDDFSETDVQPALKV